MKNLLQSKTPADFGNPNWSNG